MEVLANLCVDVHDPGGICGGSGRGRRHSLSLDGFVEFCTDLIPKARDSLLLREHVQLDGLDASKFQAMSVAVLSKFLKHVPDMPTGD